ncbi:MAG: hypothetical protein KDD42_00630, partial [Bdellovibrionales bacterium]|nr:hypothetical protein [Bdellovibrionales bacterium]
DDIVSWAKSHTCLFTVLDYQDNPKMVVEFFSGFESAIEVRDVDSQRYTKPMLAASGISYVTFSLEEFSDLLDPQSGLDFCTYLNAKLEQGDDD